MLRTERLVLRPLTPALATALLDGETVPAPPARGFPRTDDVTVLELAVTGQAGRSYVVEHDGASVGTLGVAGSPTPDGEQEIGYGLVAPARGRGLGTEAVAALCAVLDTLPELHRITAEAQPGNLASLALLRRLGFVEVGGASPGHVKLARATPGRPKLQERIAGRHVC